MDKKDYISASEIGDFVFCKRGWWLRRQGLLPVTMAMILGNQQHSTLFSRLLHILLLQKIVRVLLVLGVILLALLIILLLLK